MTSEVGGTNRVTVLALTVTLGAATLAWAWYEDRPADGSLAQRFRIPAGEPLAVSSQRLADGHLIRNPLVFRWLYKVWQGTEPPVGNVPGPGRHDSPPGRRVLPPCAAASSKVTVPEGWTSTKIARLLEEKRDRVRRRVPRRGSASRSLGPAGRRTDLPRGAAVPRHLPFPPGSIGGRRRQKPSSRPSTTERPRGQARFTPEEWDRRIILASIVEREYRAPEEAPLIASVFANRLEKGIALASCATIEYILTEVRGRRTPSGSTSSTPRFLLPSIPT